MQAQSAKGVQEWPLPTTSDLSVEQARGACQRAIADGKKRLQIDLLLPLIGATDLDDWPVRRLTLSFTRCEVVECSYGSMRSTKERCLFGCKFMNKLVGHIWGWMTSKG